MRRSPDLVREHEIAAVFVSVSRQRLLEQLPLAMLAQVRDETSADPAPDAEELGFLPVLAHANCAYRYTLRISYASRTLLAGQIKTSMIWNPGFRIYYGTDAFTNTCIDKNYMLYSSNLRLYCFVPGEGFGMVRIIRGSN